MDFAEPDFPTDHDGTNGIGASERQEEAARGRAIPVKGMPTMCYQDWCGVAVRQIDRKRDTKMPSKQCPIIHRLLAAGVLVLFPWSARAETEVDLALVLAVDVSGSMESEEQELQRQGFVEAFRSPEVQDAIRKGFLGRIAVEYVEWAGAAYQEVVVPWTVISQPAEALGFAARFAQTPPRRMGYTSFSGAIYFSLRQLRESGVQSVRQVI